MKKFTIALIFSLLAMVSMAAVFTSTGTGNWSDATKWTYTGTDADGIPDADDDATIVAGQTITLTADAAVNNLTLLGTSGTRLVIGNFIIEVSGTVSALNNNPPANLITTGTGRMKFIGNSRALFGTNWAANPQNWRFEVALNSGETGTASSNVKGGNVIISSGTFHIGTTTLPRDLRIDGLSNGTGSLTIAAGATLIVTKECGIRTSTATTYGGPVDISGTLVVQGSYLNGTININNGGVLILKRLATTALLSYGASTPNFNYASGSTLKYELEGTVGRVLTGAELNNAAGPVSIYNLVLNNANGIDLQASPVITNKLQITSGDIITTTGQSISYATNASLHYNGSAAQTTGSLDIPASNGPTNLIIDNAAGVTYNYASERSISGNLNITNGSIFNIGPGAKFTLAGTITNPGGTSGLVIKSDAVGTGSFMHDINGLQASMEQYLTEDKWHHVSSPVADAVSGVYTGLYLMRWKEMQNYWQFIGPTYIPMTPGSGWSAWSFSGVTGNTTVNFAGTLNNGDVSPAVSYTAGQGEGWNLIGNPFCSAIEWNTNWTGAHIDEAIYVWDGTQYLNWNRTTLAGTKGDGLIAATQGFFIKANASSPSITIPQDERTHTSSGFYKDSEGLKNDIHLFVSGNGFQDQAIMHMFPGATNGFDHSFDALKMDGITEAPQLYFISGSDRLSVNALPLSGYLLKTRMGFKVGEAGVYTISLKPTNSLVLPVYLEDTQEGVFVNLRNSNYSFTADPADNADRFVIHLTHDDVDDFATESDQVFKAGIFTSGNTLHIDMMDEPGTYTLFNTLGEEVMSGDLKDVNNDIEFNGRGVHIVRVATTSGQMITQKVSFR